MAAVDTSVLLASVFTLGAPARSAMPSGGTTSAVHRYLDGDGAAQDMLARGVLNYRAFARWLIDQHGWDTTEEAVVSALRRYPTDRSPNGLVPATDVLSKSWLNSRTNVCSLTLPRTIQVHRRLANLFEIVDPSKGELLRIMEGDRTVKVLVSGTNLEAVKEAMSPHQIHDIATGLAEYSISCPDSVRHITGVLAIVHNALASHRINVLEAACGVGEITVFVGEDDSLKAYQVLNALVSDEA